VAIRLSGEDNLMESKQPVVLFENLRPSEIRFVAAMQQLGYGSFEALRITAGELKLDPWPTTVRSVKFGSATTNQPGFETGQFELKKQVAELFAQVRAINDGMIRILEVRGGLPFSMEICVGC
jgi:hypothetical protein